MKIKHFLIIAIIIAISIIISLISINIKNSENSKLKDEEFEERIEKLNTEYKDTLDLVGLDDVRELIKLKETAQMQIFLKNDVSEQEKEEITEVLLKMEEIEHIESYTKEQALEKMKIKLGENSELLKGYEGENNIFPDSILVTIADSSKASEISEQINEIPGIDEVIISRSSSDDAKIKIEKEIEKIRKEVYDE